MPNLILNIHNSPVIGQNLVVLYAYVYVGSFLTFERVRVRVVLRTFGMPFWQCLDWYKRLIGGSARLLGFKGRAHTPLTLCFGIDDMSMGPQKLVKLLRVACRRALPFLGSTLMTIEDH